MEKKLELCYRCKYLQITWDKNMPYACRAMGFKSKIIPCRVTKNVSNEQCLSFKEKHKKS